MRRFLHIFPTFGIVHPFDDSPSNGCVVIIHFYFNLHLLTTNDCEPVFICLWAIHISSSGRGLFKYFVYFLSVLFTFLLSCKSFCVFFCRHILYQMYDLQIVFPVWGPSFHFLSQCFLKNS